MLENSPLTHYDVAIIVLYFIIILGIGFYSFFKVNRSTVSGYFLAGRYMIWLMVGASLFSSNIGSEHFVGLAGSGASSGIGVAAFEFNAVIVIQLLGCLFLPVYIASGANTLPEYMKKRFGGTRIRTYLSCLYILLYVFAKISVDLYSGALFIEQGLRWNMYSAIFFILLMTVICTITGGLTAVMYTDTVQTFLILFGAAITAFLSVKKVGGFQALRYKYMNAIPTSFETTFLVQTFNNQSSPQSNPIFNGNQTTIEVSPYLAKGCGLPRADSWKILRNPWTSDVPWLGIFLGQTTVSLWYWCTDQMMVQRALAAKSLSHAQGGTVFVGYLKLLPLFLLIIPGMAARVLYTDLVACSNPDKCERICGNRVSCANIAYPLMAFDILPPGMKGIMFSVMLAALMSDLASVFNSSATLFTIDIWHKLRRNASVKELMIVGRVFVLIMVAASIVWIPVIKTFQGGQLYIYIQSVGSYLAPPIAAVFLLAVLWPRCNEKGAFWSLMIGLSVGILRMILDLIYQPAACGNTTQRKQPAIISHVHFLYFAAILFWITVVSAIIISLCTAKPLKKHLIRTTYWTRFLTDDLDTVPYKEIQALKPEKYDDIIKGDDFRFNDEFKFSGDLPNGTIGMQSYIMQQKPQQQSALNHYDTGIETKKHPHPNYQSLNNRIINSNSKMDEKIPKNENNNNNINNISAMSSFSNASCIGLLTKTSSMAHNDVEIMKSPLEYAHISLEKQPNVDLLSKTSNNFYGKGNKTQNPYNFEEKKNMNSILDQNHNENNNVNNHPEEKIKLKDILLKAWNWFLGLETEEIELVTDNELSNGLDDEIVNSLNPSSKVELARIKRERDVQRLLKIQSLKQRPLTEFFIKANVVIIISLAIFIMIYFTV